MTGSISADRTALELRGLSITASSGRHQQLLHPTSLRVAVGETLAVAGESGSGKSLMSRAIVGLLPRGVRATGSVVYDGTELLNKDRSLRSVRGHAISLLMQDPFTMLNPLQDIRAHVRESLRRRPGGSRRSRANEVARRLREVGLSTSVGSKYPHELSGGMLQRVALACALAKDPHLLIADEPTTALDASIQLDVLDLLKSIQSERSMTLILITHDMDVAEYMSHRLAVLYAGRLVEQGPTPEVTRYPGHPYTWGLLRSRLSIDSYQEVLYHIPGSKLTAGTASAQGCNFADRCDWVIDACREAAPDGLELHPASVRGSGLSRTTLTSESACIREPTIAADLAILNPSRNGRRAPRGSTSQRGHDGEGVVLSITDLKKSFSARTLRRRALEASVLSGVSFDVFERESVGLVGESGSGKTTLLRCVLGLARPDSGSISLDGRDVSSYRTLGRNEIRQVRRTVQCVFQDPYSSLSPARSVGATLAEAASLADERRFAREAHLEMVGLPASYVNRMPAELSGGERQRVAIARALVARPKLLLCDEPVAALDLSVQAQMLTLLRDLKATLGFSMVFISHDLSVIRQICDQVFVLNAGRIVESGMTEVLLRSPADSFTTRLVEAASPSRGSGSST